MAAPPDLLLDTALSQLAEALAAIPDARLVFAPEELPGIDGGIISHLGRCGLVQPAEPSASVICNGCERSCSMPVTFHKRAQTGAPASFVKCDKREDIGLVPVDPERLRRWAFSMETLASAVTAALGLPKPSSRLVSGSSWSLGDIVHGSRRVPVYLAAHAGATDPPAGLQIVLSQTGSDASVPAVMSLLGFRGGTLRARDDRIAEILSRQFGDTRLACEILYERGDVILVNHIIGKRRTLASPNFNSATDNAFQYLYDHPGQPFTRDELQGVAGVPALGDLHKIAELLHFDGILKKLFFRISKNRIAFDRTATVGQLAALDIDPTDVL